MASNKNQHYVPQCYLRQFAVENSRVGISLFNLDRKKFIKSVPIRHQCSKNYFYGKEIALEKVIQSVENLYSPLVKNILEDGYHLKDEDKIILQKFWLLQYLRTEAASRRSVEMTEKMGEIIGDNARDFRVELADAVQNAMHVFASEIKIIDDLKVCLVRNKTNIDFVTSDDPSILTNKWFLIDKKTKGESIGLGSAGNLILLPLTPKILFLGYDEHIYSVSQKNGWLNIDKREDIEALNEHQYLNCRANLFTHNSNGSEYIHKCYESLKGNRPKARRKINYAILDQVNGRYKKFIVVDKKEAKDHEGEAVIHCETVNPKPSKWPKQIRWRLNGYAFSNGTGIGFIRQKRANSMPNKGFRRIRARK